MNQIELIKQLRAKTGASIAVCKKSLEKADYDIKKAILIMRQEGIIKSAERANRQANNGLVSIVKQKDTHKQSAIMMVANCETDFVAKSNKFKQFTEQVLNILVSQQKSINIESDEIKKLTSETSLVIGEKIVINKAVRIEAEQIGTHIFQNSIGAIVGIRGGNDQLADDIAMHIAAENPKYLEQLPESIIEEEKKIIEKQYQIKDSANIEEKEKNKDLLGKILQGKIQKIKEETCFLYQKYLKDNNLTIKQVLKDSQIIEFVRFELV